MIELTDEMAKLVDNALEDGVPCMMGTASKAGMPNISFRGSVMVFDKQHLAYWERALNIAIQNLEENPQIEILYRGRERGVGWRFYGRAEIEPGRCVSKLWAEPCSVSSTETPSARVLAC
jgi:predicted pyridoxine 5'-phosphate oxidase superfamily flavin-nucleotide-binding protein